MACRLRPPRTEFAYDVDYSASRGLLVALRCFSTEWFMYTAKWVPCPRLALVTDRVRRWPMADPGW